MRQSGRYQPVPGGKLNTNTQSGCNLDTRARQALCKWYANEAMNHAELSRVCVCVCFSYCSSTDQLRMSTSDFLGVVALWRRWRRVPLALSAVNATLVNWRHSEVMSRIAGVPRSIRMKVQDIGLLTLLFLPIFQEQGGLSASQKSATS